MGILILLIRAQGGITKFYVTKIYVTILKNPYKTKSFKARMLIFSVQGTYHRGSIPFVFVHSNPISLGARGVKILKNPYKTIDNEARMPIFYERYLP